MSTQGFLIMSNSALPLGAVMELKCELYAERILRCCLEVTHVTDSCMGTKIVKISGYSLNLCREFIGDHYLSRNSVRLIQDTSDNEPASE